MQLPKSCVTPIITDNMVTLARTEDYKNKREFGRKLRLVTKDLEQSVPVEYRQYAVWCINKPTPRSHELYFRTGVISVQIRLPKEILCNVLTA